MDGGRLKGGIATHAFVYCVCVLCVCAALSLSLSLSLSLFVGECVFLTRHHIDEVFHTQGRDGYACKRTRTTQMLFGEKIMIMMMGGRMRRRREETNVMWVIMAAVGISVFVWCVCVRSCACVYMPRPTKQLHTQTCAHTHTIQEGCCGRCGNHSDFWHVFCCSTNACATSSLLCGPIILAGSCKY